MYGLLKNCNCFEIVEDINYHEAHLSLQGTDFTG